MTSAKPSRIGGWGHKAGTGALGEGYIGRRGRSAAVTLWEWPRPGGASEGIGSTEICGFERTLRSLRNGGERMLAVASLLRTVALGKIVAGKIACMLIRLLRYVLRSVRTVEPYDLRRACPGRPSGDVGDCSNCSVVRCSASAAGADWSRCLTCRSDRQSVGMKSALYIPNAVHLFSMLIDECSDSIGRTEFLVDFEKAIIPLLQLTRSLPRRRLHERAIGCAVGVTRPSQ